MAAGGGVTALAGRVHILLHEHALVGRSPLSLSICKGIGGGGRRYDDRRDGGDHRERQ